jgi:hypothetical protein
MERSQQEQFSAPRRFVMPSRRESVAGHRSFYGQTVRNWPAQSRSGAQSSFEVVQASPLVKTLVTARFLI